MSDQGEKTCPLCAEEMDLTDQQLKPCKCGYEICVWCWHYIMDMAEKDRTEGRCPACRTPYDKAKIEGMAAKCERLVSEVNMEKKKTQKAKAKTSDGRKQLNSVRVIQRNLVYIVGLPLNLADEDLLQRKEYFGQYGKVLKVSMSRTASGVIQQFPNSTCSVYITYAREEEAIRCIQSAHGFTLDGRCLKACFGTTKYCHAWLRSVPCTNPDCLYLHEVGSQEDSFTKDDIISAYSRSRVPQVAGMTNSLQRRSGSVLPPPLDDTCNSASTAKPIVKNASNNILNIPKSSPPNGSVGKPALPAAASWATRATNLQSVSSSTMSSNGTSKHKPGPVNEILPFSSAVANTTHVPVSHGALKRSPLDEDCQTMHTKSKHEIPMKNVPVSHECLLRHTKESNSASPQIILAGRPASQAKDSTNNHLPVSSSLLRDDVAGILSSAVNSLDWSKQSSGHAHMQEDNNEVDEKMDKLIGNISSMNVEDVKAKDDHSAVAVQCSSHSDHDVKVPENGISQQQFAENIRQPSPGRAPCRVMAPINGTCLTRDGHDWQDDSQNGANALLEGKRNLLSFDCQRHPDQEENAANNLSDSVSFTPSSSPCGDVYTLPNSCSDSLSANRYNEKPLLPCVEKSRIESTGSGDCIDGSNFVSGEDHRENQTGNSHCSTDGNDIISNILSLDFDPWDEPLSSPHNLARILGEANQRHEPLRLPNARKVHSSNQSRFSFARQEETNDSKYDADPYGYNGRLPYNHQGSATSTAPFLDNFGISNGFHSNNSETFDSLANNLATFSSTKHSGVSRMQVSAPPGFAVPSRSPPPGFSLNERKDQGFDAFSGNHLLENSSLRSSYQALPGMNAGGSGDIEIMDPAILAVGRGRLQGGLDNAGFDVRTSLSPQLNAIENEARLQLLLQQSLSGQQSLRFPNTADNLSSLFGSYGISSRLLNQAQGNNLSSPFTQLSRQQSSNGLISNGHWDGLNDILHGGNGARMAGLLRDERHGHNFFTGYEEAKYQMPSSGDLYSTLYRM